MCMHSKLEMKEPYIWGMGSTFVDKTKIYFKVVSEVLLHGEYLCKDCGKRVIVNNAVVVDSCEEGDTNAL